MATVRELKAYLETIPEDAEVFVNCRDYGGFSYMSALNLEPYSGNVDFNTALGTDHLYLGEH
jgi:hypothetical protein